MLLFQLASSKRKWGFILDVRYEKTDLLKGLCHCHTKRRMGSRGRAHPSFGMASNFQEYNLWCQHSKSQIPKSRCHTKRRMGAAMHAHPSFGMTTRKALRSVFSWCASLLPIPRCQYPLKVTWMLFHIRFIHMSMNSVFPALPENCFHYWAVLC